MSSIDPVHFRADQSPTVALPARAIFTNVSVEVLLDISKTPGSPSGGGLPTSPEPFQNFQAIQGNVATFPFPTNPPDTMGTVGKNHVFTMLNQAVKIQTKSGDETYFTNSLRDFWTYPNIAARAG